MRSIHPNSSNSEFGDTSERGSDAGSLGYDPAADRALIMDESVILSDSPASIHLQLSTPPSNESHVRAALCPPNAPRRVHDPSAFFIPRSGSLSSSPTHSSPTPSPRLRSRPVLQSASRRDENVIAAVNPRTVSPGMKQVSSSAVPGVATSFEQSQTTTSQHSSQEQEMREDFAERQADWKEREARWVKREADWKEREAYWKKQVADWQGQVANWQGQVANWQGQVAFCNQETQHWREIAMRGLGSSSPPANLPS
ncbi:hypothetical protein BDY19DRAFT_996859 [Irpex rosettiformis]|uniref:Uncharacterized protein n=1 Tax=Irpex rosettiformis TaxID=378272 RepID=A0ACB8TTQ3_9APHY|nr:hypothetical protein BDY19DRAFT_996859 [Irpex rosettiformis]